jgi:polyphosphate kinase 2 (PPK2 family)
VVPIAAPNDIEKAHHYLWRFWAQLPKAGHIAIFDRTWYGRVLVERVEGFCTEAQWRRAYREINAMEQQLVHFGTVLFKFWLHIDPDEQLRRFQERQEDAHKQWKITEEDWRNRSKLDQYRDAVEEMLYRTSTPYAPWTIVESNCKWYARVKVLETVCEAIQQALRA